MTPEAQRIAIAEACGWKDLHMTPARYPIQGHSNLFLEGTPPRDKTIWNLSVPDYLNDLNAMNEAEILLLGPDWDEEKWAIYKIRLHQTIEPHRHVINSTAAQRAEALLRTIGKWTE